MTAKEFLEQAWKSKLRIESLTSILEMLKSTAEYSSAPISDAPRPATRNVRKTEDAVIKIVELEERIEAERQKRNEVLAVIASIEDEFEQLLISKRYIERKRWSEIAKEIYSSERAVYYAHTKILAEIERLQLNALVSLK